jgi:hypothetical protein
MPPEIIMRKKLGGGNPMAAKYEVGQKVTITPVKDQRLSPRDSDLEPYAGRIGEVVHYYWISPTGGEVFYIYTVRMESDNQEVVVHEDELSACLA